MKKKKQSFEKVDGYIGVFKRPSLKKDPRKEGKTKPDVSYYVRYEKNGHRKRDFVGKHSDGMTPAQASILRTRLMDGEKVDLPNPRSGKTKPLKINVTDETADDYGDINPEDRPAKFWTFERLFEVYVQYKGGEDNYPNYKTDNGNFKNHLKKYIGHLRPEEITKFKIQSIRNKLLAKTVIMSGTLTSIKATREKIKTAEESLKRTRKKAERETIKKRIEKLKKKLDGAEKRTKKNKRKLAPATVENAIEFARRLANFGPDNDLCPGPAQRIQVKKIDNEKTEDLTPDEIKRLWAACDADANQDVADMIKIALLTGLRRGSLFNLAWKHVNFQRDQITIKAIRREDRHSKSGRQILIPMSPPVKKILEKRAAVADLKFSPYVFPGRDGGRRVYANKQARRIIDAAGLPDDFRPFHGQRHAYASNLANTGHVDLYQIGKLLGHSKHSSAMTQRYSHLREKALKRASGMMAGIVMDAITTAEPPQDGQDRKKKAK